MKLHPVNDPSWHILSATRNQPSGPSYNSTLQQTRPTHTSAIKQQSQHINNIMGLFSKEKEASPRNSYNGPPPPSYDQPPSYAPSSSSTHTSGQTIKFPQRMVYNASWWSSKSTIGPSKEEPMFQFVSPNRMNCFSRKHSVLNDGMDTLSPPLGSVGRERGTGWKKTHSLIRVSPSPGSADQELSIRLEDDYRSTHPFVMPIHGQETRFEWRSTSGGAEVKTLSGGYNWGWKLVRIDGPYTIPGGRSEMPEGFTSDGREVVAVGAHPKLFKKSLEFMFLGSGARGEMGRDFEIVAVLGFLRLYEIYMEQQMAANNASAAASSSAAAAAAS